MPEYGARRIEVPYAKESVVGARSLFAMCNHGEGRQKELAPNIQVALAQQGSLMKVYQIEDGWTGIVNTIHKLNIPETPARVFFAQLMAGGHVISASHDAFQHLTNLIMAKSMSHTLGQLHYLEAYSSVEEITQLLKSEGILT